MKYDHDSFVMGLCSGLVIALVMTAAVVFHLWQTRDHAIFIPFPQQFERSETGDKP